MLRLCVPGYPAAKLRRDLFRKIAHPGIHPVSRTGLVGKPAVDGQNHLIRFWLIRERLVLVSQPQELFLAVSLADIRAERDQLLVDHILEGIRLGRIGRALNGDRPLVVCIGRGTPGAVLFLYIHSDSAVLADTIVAACLFGNRQEDIPQCFHRALSYHTVGRDAVDGVRPLPGVVRAEFCVRYQ